MPVWIGSAYIFVSGLFLGCPVTEPHGAMGFTAVDDYKVSHIQTEGPVPFHGLSRCCAKHF